MMECSMANNQRSPEKLECSVANSQRSELAEMVLPNGLIADVQERELSECTLANEQELEEPAEEAKTDCQLPLVTEVGLEVV